MLTRREAIATTAAAVAFAFGRREARAFPRGGGASAIAASNLVGVNALNPLNYADTVFPFLNLLKSAGSNTPWCPWFTSVYGGTLDTGEEAYLQMDANQNVTSLVAGNGFSGTQVFNCAITLFCFMYNGLQAGATYLYPPGPYTLVGQGEGTFYLQGDAASVASSSPGITVSGNKVISTSTSGTWEVTFNCPSQTVGGGIQIAITALPSSTNYLQFQACVQSTYLAAYNAGQTLHPIFKSSVLGAGLGFTGYNAPVRFMQALNAFGQDLQVTFTANLALHATSGTVSSFNDFNIGTSSTWTRPSGTYYAVFATGQVMPVTCTYGSSSLIWSTPLSAAISTSAVGAMAFIAKGTWAQRPLPGNFAWTNDTGIPYETAIQCCNELGLPPWLNIPATANIVDSTYATSLAQLMRTGTGASLSGWNVSSFSGVTSGLPRVEYSNETWNGTYLSFNLMLMMGQETGFNTAQGNEYYGGQEYYGVQIAGICSAFSSVYGGSFASSVRVVCMTQEGSNTYLNLSMNTPDWTSRAYLSGIGAVGCAPYFGTDVISAADAATIKGQSNPVNELISLAYSATGASGHTYSSLGGAGWIQATIEQMQTFVTGIQAQPWGALPIECYEGGSALDDAYDIEASVSGWRVNVLVATQNDSRFSQLEYDPTHTLNATYAGYFEEMKKLGISFICQLCAVGYEMTASSTAGSDSWGALQSDMQIAAASGLSSLPSKYQGIMNYINRIPS